MGFLDDIRSELSEFRDSKLFPIYWLTGSLFVSLWTSDTLWVYVGVGGFLILTLARAFFD